jgi:hypothetical protein
MAYSYTHAQVSAAAVIEGLGIVDIIRADITYSINSIPIATILVATGTPAGASYKTNVNIASLTAYRRRVKIWLTVGAVQKKVFEGSIMSVAPERSQTSMGIRVSIIHWLEDLRGTSAFSDERTPSAMWDLDSPSTQTSLTGTDAPMYSVEGICNNLESLYTGDLGVLLTTCIRTLATGGTVGKGYLLNSSALNVLKRLSTSLRFDFDALPSVTTGVSNAVGQSFLSVYGGGNLYDSLMRVAPMFMYMLIPSSDRIVVAAYTPVMSGKFVKVHLSADDYVYSSGGITVPRAVKALLLYDNKGFDSGINAPVRQNPLFVLSFVRGLNKGMIDAAPLPEWLSDPGSATNLGNTWAMLEGIKGRGRRSAGQQNQSNAVSSNSGYSGRQSVAKIYASMALTSQLFGDSVMSITAPYRTDIGPGMNISIASPDASDDKLYGFVQAVGISVDCENHAISTNISLSHLRNKKDNDSLGLVSGLYKSVVTGYDISGGARVSSSSSDVIGIGETPPGVIGIGETPPGVIGVGETPPGVIGIGETPPGVIGIGETPPGVIGIDETPPGVVGIG